MNNTSPSEESSEFRKILGFIFLLLAFLGLYWVADIVMQLWSSPRSVPLVSIFIDLIDPDQKPIIVNPDQGAELNLPASWPVLGGIFLIIVLISSVSLLIKACLTFSLALLFPVNDKINRKL